MRYFIPVVLFCFSLSAAAQNAPAWKWAKSDTTAQIILNPSYLKEVVSAHGSRVLWGVLKNKKISYNPSAYGDYALTEYDTLGNTTNTTTLTGKISLKSIEADSAGNWYVLCMVYDSLRFANGQTFTTNIMANESIYFLFKLHAGTLAPDWCQHLAADYQTTVNCLSIHRNDIYLATDSGLISKIWKVNAATGTRALLITQGGQNRVSSLQADDKGNIYVAASCASPFTGINFNGATFFPVNTANQYPAFIVRYKSNGQHDWHTWMTDITCTPRKLTLATNNLVYYSGPVMDSMTFGGFLLRKPKWVYNFMLARLDSTGAVAWVRQLTDTLAGDARLEQEIHAVVSIDSSITIFPNVRGYVDWGSGITSNTAISGQAMLVHYKADGTALWTKQIGGRSTIAQQIAGNSTDVWVTGNGRDSFSYSFDAITVPATLLYPPYVARLYTGARGQVLPAPTAIQQAAQALELTVVPNPATNTIAVSGMEKIKEPVRIALIDMTGRIIYSNTLSITSNKMEIPVAGFARGVYLLQVMGKTTQYISKVILR